MTYLAYTNCETGFRHFVHIIGVDVSYDPKFIRHIIDERRAQAHKLQELHAGAEEHHRQVAEQMDLPPFLKTIMKSNQAIVEANAIFTRRLSTAEVVVNGELVRDVHYYVNLDEAILYTAGPKPKDSDDLPQSP